MRKSIAVTIAVILLTLICYILYNSGKEEGETARKEILENRTGNK
ncbi:MAG: hypothetical protein ABI687_08800 [Flavitalea sp.]